MLHKEILIKIGACAAPDNTGRFVKMGYIIFGVLLTFSMATVVANSVIVVLCDANLDSQHTLEAIMQIAASLSAVSMYLAVFRHRTKLRKVFEEFDDILTQCKGEYVARFYMKANNWSRDFEQDYIYGITFGFSGLLILLGFISILQSYHTDAQLDPTKFYLPMAAELPWRTTTISGWFAAFFYYLVYTNAFFIVTSTMLSAFVRCGLYFYANRQHFHQLMLQLDLNARDERAAKEVLCYTIRFHIRTKYTFFNIAETFSGAMFFEIFCGTIYISCAIFNIEMMFHYSILSTTMTLVDMVCSIFPTYLYCFIGSFTTDNFSKYGDGFYESNWIDLPVHLKKYIAIAICDAQRPLYFEGLGLFALNLKTFAKVIITAVGYYLTYRALSNDD